MAAIDFTTTITALDAGIAGATGADEAILQDVRDRIAKLGHALTSRFTLAVDTAKGVWEANASAVAIEAHEAADHVTTEEGGTPGAPVAWNAYSIADLLARIGAASQLASTEFRKQALVVHTGALAAAFHSGPDSGALYSRAPTVHDYANNASPGQPSVAAIEREIYAAIQEANEALALAAF